MCKELFPWEAPLSEHKSHPNHPCIQEAYCIRLADFKPILCVNLTYKLLTNLLAGRIMEVSPDLISPKQSAFMPGSLICSIVLEEPAHLEGAIKVWT